MGHSGALDRVILCQFGTDVKMNCVESARLAEHCEEARVFLVLVRVWICALLLGPGSLNVLAQDLSRAELVARQETEESWSGSTVQRIHLRAAADEDTLDLIGNWVRQQFRSSIQVGVRFVIGEWPRIDVDVRESRRYYAWRLYRVDGEVVKVDIGVSPREVASRINAFRPSGDETLLGIWVDYYDPRGVVALLKSAAELRYAYLDAPKERWRLHLRRGVKGPGTHYEAVAFSEKPGQWRQVGRGVRWLAVVMLPDGRLGEIDRKSSNPWLLASPIMGPGGNAPR